MSDAPTIPDPAADSPQPADAAADAAPGAQDAGKSELPRATLDELRGQRPDGSSADVGLELILDVPVTVSLELGRTALTVRDLLQLNQGSVVEFDRRVGESLDVLVNGTLLAHGELVVVDDRFGIRLTDVVSPAQRLEQLNE